MPFFSFPLCESAGTFTVEGSLGLKTLRGQLEGQEVSETGRCKGGGLQHISWGLGGRCAILLQILISRPVGV